MCGEGSSSEDETEQSCSRDSSAAAGSNASPPHTENERSSFGAAPELDAALWSTLPDNLQVKIIAGLPLHSLFRASLLSKQWRPGFYPDFVQHEVNCASPTSWSSFGPLVVTERQELLGFESSSRLWCQLPPLSYLPDEVHMNTGTLIAASGSLLCFTEKWPASAPVFVTNPLTRKWRQLPPYAEGGDFFKIQMQIACQKGSKTYKVLIFLERSEDLGRIFMFDSTEGTWTKKECSTVQEFDYSRAVIINEVLHKLVFVDRPRSDRTSCYGRISFDLNEKIWKKVSYLYEVFPDKPPRPLETFKFDQVSGLFVCGSKVISIAGQFFSNSDIVISNSDSDHESDSDSDHESDRDSDHTKRRLSVFQLDLDEGRASLVSTAPIELLTRALLIRRSYRFYYGWDQPHNKNCTYIGDCIYMGRVYPSVVYNLATQACFCLILKKPCTIQNIIVGGGDLKCGGGLRSHTSLD